MIDQTMLLYVAISLVAFYGFGLFIWWWNKVGKASYMFKYITCLFLGSGLHNLINAWARYYRVVGDTETYLAIMGGWWWPARLYVSLIILVCIVGHISYRAFYLRGKLE